MKTMCGRLLKAYISVVSLFLVNVTLANNEMRILRADPGANVTVLWNMSDILHHDPEEIQFRLYHNGARCFVCRLSTCLDQPYSARERLASDNVTIGFSISDVKSLDAGEYEFSYFCGSCARKQEEKRVVLYVFQEPETPHVTSTRNKHEMIINCSSRSTSAPDTYRHGWILVYQWYIEPKHAVLVDNYKIVGNIVRIKSPKKEHFGMTFSCIARERDSTLWSEMSDPLTLKVPYVSEPRVILWRSVEDPNNFVYSCEADCYPACNYVWLDENRQIVHRGSHLEHLEQAGHVVCRAENKDAAATGHIRAAVVDLGVQLSCGTVVQWRDGVVSLAVVLSLVVVAASVGICFLLRKNANVVTCSAPPTPLDSTGKNTPSSSSAPNTYLRPHLTPAVHTCKTHVLESENIAPENDTYMVPVQRAHDEADVTVNYDALVEVVDKVMSDTYTSISYVKQ